MTMHNLWMVIIIAVVTMITRFLPFLIFGENRKTPNIVLHLGKVLPCAIMGMLVVYSLKDTAVLSAPYGIPELIGIVTVAGLHIWKRNSLLSIGAGTLVYMLLIQLVF